MLASLIILDRSHRVFVWREAPSELWKLPQVSLTQEGPILEQIEHAVRERWKIDLPTPAGSVSNDFVFILEDELPLTSPTVTWLRLIDLQHHLPVALYEGIFWPLYRATMLSGYEPPKRGLDVIFFGNAPIMAAKLAHLVVIGKKTATSGSLQAMRISGSLVPYPGLITLVTDFFGYPQCLIETLQVREVPFCRVGADVAACEGEGDLSLADWQKGHREYFQREGKQLGYSFTDDSPVLNEFFRVIQVLGQPPR